MNKTVKRFLIIIGIYFTIGISCECQNIYNGRLETIKEKSQVWYDANVVDNNYNNVIFANESIARHPALEQMKVDMVSANVNCDTSQADSIKWHIEEYVNISEKVKYTSSISINKTKEYYLIFDKKFNVIGVYHNHEFIRYN